MIHNLFPVPIGCYDLDRALTDKELSFIKGQHKYDNEGNKTSADRKILERNELSELRKFMSDSVCKYFKEVYRPRDCVDLKITQSWCNYTEPGQYHHKHAHPNSFISGVFYPQANLEKDRVFFYRDGYEQVYLPPEEWNLWNSKSWWFAVGTGQLYLFPSGVQHMVPTTESEETRISLSFNTFPVGEVGVDRDLTCLHIDGAS